MQMPGYLSRRLPMEQKDDFSSHLHQPSFAGSIREDAQIPQPPISSYFHPSPVCFSCLNLGDGSLGKVLNNSRARSSQSMP